MRTVSSAEPGKPAVSDVRAGDGRAAYLRRVEHACQSGGTDSGATGAGPSGGRAAVHHSLFAAEPQDVGAGIFPNRQRAGRFAQAHCRPAGLRAGDPAERERRVLTARYGLGDNKPCSLAKLAKTMVVSAECVRKIEKAALRRLRQPRA